MVILCHAPRVRAVCRQVTRSTRRGTTLTRQADWTGAADQSWLWSRAAGGGILRRQETNHMDDIRPTARPQVRPRPRARAS